MTKRHSRMCSDSCTVHSRAIFLFCMCFYTDTFLCCSVFILTAFYSIVGSVQEQKSPHSCLQVEHKILNSASEVFSSSKYPLSYTIVVRKPIVLYSRHSLSVKPGRTESLLLFNTTSFLIWVAYCLFTNVL